MLNQRKRWALTNDLIHSLSCKSSVLNFTWSFALDKDSEAISNFSGQQQKNTLLTDHPHTQMI